MQCINFIKINKRESLNCMGLFKKLFKGKDKPIKPNVPPVNKYQEDWDFYLTKVDGLVGSVMVNLGLHKIAPLLQQPNIIWVSVKMNAPDDEGLSSASEFDTLVTIEERLTEFVCAKHHATYVGRLTSNGSRDFYFYMGDTLLYDKTVSEAMVAFPGYDYDWGSKEDTKWASYFDFLYPLPEQYQSMLNRRVLYNLEKHGDTLTKERRVDHWLYFDTPEDREVFIDKIKDDGFDIVGANFNPVSKTGNFSLQISRVDKVDFDSVDHYILYLSKLAEECNGVYDGWETKVEND